MNNALLTVMVAIGVACVGAETSTEKDILELISEMDEVQTAAPDVVDNLQLEDSLVTVNCRLSCSLTNYKRTCGCINNRCVMWKNPCLAFCNGAEVFSDKDDAACISSSSSGSRDSTENLQVEN